MEEHLKVLKIRKGKSGRRDVKKDSTCPCRLKDEVVTTSEGSQERLSTVSPETASPQTKCCQQGKLPHWHLDISLLDCDNKFILLRFVAICDKNNENLYTSQVLPGEEMLIQAAKHHSPELPGQWSGVGAENHEPERIRTIWQLFNDSIIHNVTWSKA